MVAVTEHVAKTARHSTFYLAAGPTGGVPIIFVHGWPELSRSWRHQLPVFGGLGFRAIAPDMRGYGRSGKPARTADYAQEHIVADMLELQDALGVDKAVWVGHDWGAAVVWNIASHHPQRCHAIANLCVPYAVLDRSWERLLSLVDRTMYPQTQYPYGQWDYIRHYEEQFAAATSTFEANVYNTVSALFRGGDARNMARPGRTAQIRESGGWFAGQGVAPALPRDAAVLNEEDLLAYTAALQAGGFFGPDAYYLNRDENEAYAQRALNGGRIDLPVLFMEARHDAVCTTHTTRLADPMRESCSDLSYVSMDSGHWLPQEKPGEVNAALAHWLATRMPHLWQRQGMERP